MYILYKNPIQLETLYIVQYLNYNNIDFLPNIIIEKNYPNFVKNLPTIYYKNKFYNGLEEVISLYENILNLGFSLIWPFSSNLKLI